MAVSICVDADAGAVFGRANEFDARGFVEVDQGLDGSLCSLVHRVRVFTSNYCGCADCGVLGNLTYGQP